MLLQRVDHRFQHERGQRQPRALLLVGRRVFLPQRVQVRDIGLIELGDVRNGVPVLRHAPGDDLAQRRERLLRNRTPLGEINLLGRGLGAARRAAAAAAAVGLDGEALQLWM